MMFSTKAEYGVRVMVELARRAGAGRGRTSRSPLAEIAEHDGLPLAYLEHLVARLRKAGLVDSRRGSRGGYLLARPPSEITMAEVVEALEGSIAPIECISQASDGSIVCSRESDPEPCLPDQAAVDARARRDRAHAAGDDARGPRARTAARRRATDACPGADLPRSDAASAPRAAATAFRTNLTTGA